MIEYIIRFLNLYLETFHDCSYIVYVRDLKTNDRIIKVMSKNQSTILADMMILTNDFLDQLSPKNRVIGREVLKEYYNGEHDD